jgi:hypothetical protein
MPYYTHHPIALAFFSRSIRSRESSAAHIIAILAARKLAQYEAGTRVPATVSAIADAIHWAEQIMARIDQRWPAK